MEISIHSGQIWQQKTACLLLFVSHGVADNSLFSIPNGASKGMLQSVMERGEPGKKPGKELLIPAPLVDGIERTLLISQGEEGLDCKNIFKIADGAVNALKKAGVENAVISLDGLGNDTIFSRFCQYFSQALVASSYVFSGHKEKESKALKNITFLYNGNVELDGLVKKGSCTGHGINVAKELGNLPGNVCTPSYLAKKAEELAGKHNNFFSRSLDEQAMSELGMGSFLSVAKGSSEEGRLIIMEYRNGKSEEAPYVLLGKGITFDSGGISLKPGAKMDEMKYDMCGAASVMGVMEALTRFKPEINVIGVIASAENMPSGNASKPGDIVTSMSGKTIEILNTDAEGRLVLCDALTYIERFEPRAVVDIATLTGACVTALGHHTSGLISNDDQLAEELTAFGIEYNDAVWRLPTGELYDKQLESNFADLANIGGPAAGTITAGCFLEQFAKKYPWAHLDIAGTAWTSGKEKGASGRPVSLLMNYLCSKAG